MGVHQTRKTGDGPHAEYEIPPRLHFSDTSIGEDNSVLFGGTASPQGTEGAGLLLLKFSATVWRQARSVFNPNFAYLHVAITADDSSAPAAFVRSDSNADQATDLSDALFTLSWLFLNGPVPPCLAAANVNGDDSVDIADATHLLNHLFSGGPAPVAPFPDRGPGTLPADEALGCANPPDC